MKNGQAHCRDEDASHHLPRAAAVFFSLHPSAGEDFDVVVLSYCLAWRSILMVNNTYFQKGKHNIPRDRHFWHRFTISFGSKSKR
jgi:hypothetical protein